MKYRRKGLSLWMSGVIFLTLFEFSYLQSYCRTHCSFMDFLPEKEACRARVKASKPVLVETPARPEALTLEDFAPSWIVLEILTDLQDRNAGTLLVERGGVPSHGPPLYL